MNWLFSHSKKLVWMSVVQLVLSNQPLVLTKAKWIVWHQIYSIWPVKCTYINYYHFKVTCIKFIQSHCPVLNSWIWLFFHSKKSHADYLNVCYPACTFKPTPCIDKGKMGDTRHIPFGLSNAPTHHFKVTCIKLINLIVFTFQEKWCWLVSLWMSVVQLNSVLSNQPLVLTKVKWIVWYQTFYIWPVQCTYILSFQITCDCFHISDLCPAITCVIFLKIQIYNYTVTITKAN